MTLYTIMQKLPLTFFKNYHRNLRECSRKDHHRIILVNREKARPASEHLLWAFWWSVLVSPMQFIIGELFPGKLSKILRTHSFLDSSFSKQYWKFWKLVRLHIKFPKTFSLSLASTNLIGLHKTTTEQKNGNIWFSFIMIFKMKILPS